ncbi:LysR substrate-binding domain-containing protein [Brucella pituitosa]|uniref:LysR substrate-binding domain-containing protein n=1 Tax=Brucella pituitosa TaxID=571256 RepID=UPI001FFED264|nr:LysR substrate-binding domain-containing protein [Brucella pituitosa]
MPRRSAYLSIVWRWQQKIPRLGSYHAYHPHVEVVVTTVSCVQEELRGGVELSIRRGVVREDIWPQHDVVPVLDDVDTLIMSPALYAKRPIVEPADIEGHALISSETRSGDWLKWLEAAGLQHLTGLSRQTFDHFFVARQAVEDGLGIEIGPLPMLDIDIASGRLMTPLPDVTVSRTGYVAVFPRRADPGNLVRAFVDWLRDQASGENKRDGDSRQAAE